MFSITKHSCFMNYPLYVLLHCPKCNQHFRDITQNADENEILHEIFRVVSRFFRSISCYFSKSRLPFGQCMVLYLLFMLIARHVIMPCHHAMSLVSHSCFILTRTILVSLTKGYVMTKLPFNYILTRIVLPVSWGHRRKIDTEVKAKVVAASWGTELLQVLAALAFLHQDDIWRIGWFASYSSTRPVANQPILQIVLVQNIALAFSSSINPSSMLEAHLYFYVQMNLDKSCN